MHQMLHRIKRYHTLSIRPYDVMKFQSGPTNFLGKTDSDIYKIYLREHIRHNSISNNQTFKWKSREESIKTQVAQTSIKQRRLFHKCKHRTLPLMHNMKPISKDATDDQYHFQTQQLAKFYFYHSWPELQQKETGSILQMGKEKKLSMAGKITRC